MSTSRRLLLAGSFAALMATGTSCTITKPIVCAVTTPILAFGQSSGSFCGCGCGDPRAVVAVFAALSAVGAVGGLVTGIISDINVLCGNTDEPCRNIGDPFATNNSCSSFR